MAKPLIPSQPVSLGLGIAALGAGWLLLHDAFEQRGQRAPFIIRASVALMSAWW
jgi:hypothetical protein